MAFTFMVPGVNADVVTDALAPSVLIENTIRLVATGSGTDMAGMIAIGTTASSPVVILNVANPMDVLTLFCAVAE